MAEAAAVVVVVCVVVGPPYQGLRLMVCRHRREGTFSLAVPYFDQQVGFCKRASCAVNIYQ